MAALAAPAQDAGKLPIKRVVLYKNGVGYFEHVGKVRDKQDVTIPFTSGQLNDVLKSLTVLDLDGGRITGVEYGSPAPVDRQLGDLRLPIGEKSTLIDVLGALRGARVEIRGGTAVLSGRLLGVEHKTRIANGVSQDVDYVSLIADSGELRTTEVTPAVSVKLLDRGLATQMGRFLDIVARGREADVRRMTISTEGRGERSLFVSYISEVPVWKSTYRIVLGPAAGKAPLLQGWAIVDNVVGQDWENVQLSLVAGAPQSFVQNLSQPYYARRPVIGLPESANFSPQTHEATLIPGGARLTGRVTDPAGVGVAGAIVKVYDSNNSLVGETQADNGGTYDLENLPEGTHRLEVEAPGFNRNTVNGVAVSVAQTSQRDVRLQAVATEKDALLYVPSGGFSVASNSLGSGAFLGGSRSAVVMGSGGGVGSGTGGGYGPGNYRAAAAQELGDLFEYKLKDPITIAKNRSALVPIVQSPIVAEKVSLWNEQAGLPRPQRALWLTNSTGITLDGGSFSVVEAETFAGEGIFEAIRPGEKRLVSYATDLALNASSKLGSDPERFTRVRIVRGAMTQDVEIRDRKTYTFRNEDAAPRTVIVEHPVRREYELRGDVKPIETTANWMRFRVPVESKQTASLVVEEARSQTHSYMLSNLSMQNVELFVRQKSIDKTLEEALRKVLAQKAAIGELTGRKNVRDSEMGKIFDDQQRLRENMKALRGSVEERALLQRYTQQLNEQETRLAELRKEIDELAAQIQSAQAALDQMVQDLSFDVTL
jgi:hypothetical protein